VENAPTEVLSSDFTNPMPRLSRSNVEAENQIFATGKMKRCFDFVFASVGFPDGGKRWLG